MNVASLTINGGDIVIDGTVNMQPVFVFGAELTINGGHISPGLSTRKIGDVMHKLKFSYIHKRSGNFYKVVEIPFDQQQKYIELSNEVENDETESTQLPDAEQLDLPF